MEMNSILIIDDDLAVRTSLKLLFRENGFYTIDADGPESAINSLLSNPVDLILMDMNYSLETTGVEGLRLLEEIKTSHAHIPVILITAWGSIPLAVEGMKLGAVDFINKPWNNNHLIQSVSTALKISKFEKSSQKSSRAKLEKHFDFEKIIGESPSFVEILETVSRVADTNAPVLITGESGTGKELIAEAIHQNSRRRNQPFVKVNLGGISSNLFESEMFGHKKGAYTDARSDRVGRFEMADSGSIFLDEIGDLDPYSQVKMLRVLQDRSFEKLGSSRAQKVDVRIITATNRPLEDMVESNDFREDLYYRVNLITIVIPPLRERPQDIPPLVDHFITTLKKAYHKNELSVSNDALVWLSGLPWPGNIRELKNLVERTVLVSNKSCLNQADFAKQSQAPRKKQSASGLPYEGTMTLDEVECEIIKKSLTFHKNNISKVANALGLSRAALYRRMEKFDLKEIS